MPENAPHTAEDDLIALVTQEQQGFRRILFAGFGVLLVLIGMSVALGVYYYIVSKNLEATASRLDRGAFDSRLAADRQTNQVANLERAVRRTYNEFRVVSTGSSTAADSSKALAAAEAYIRNGGHPLSSEALIEAAALSKGGGKPQEHALIVGAAAMLTWERNGDQIEPKSTGLPPILANAKASFETAAGDPMLASFANTGLAWVAFLDASSTRSSYAPAACDVVFQAVEASSWGGEPGPQPLYWRAQCERKLGRTRDALRDYALALRKSGETATASRDEAELTLAMNAFHGVGTQLIATFDAPEAELREALDLSASLCGRPEDGAKGSPRMLMARACLKQAVQLRERLRQTSNQISGSTENIGFSYLRDGDFEGAFANASAVERTGLFAWNELLRALSARHLKTPDARTAEQSARRSVRYFEAARFNPCELQVLLSKDLFAEAKTIIEQEHRGEAFGCAAAAASGG
jgi:tetratricopeptide (TPR) repeat protein